MLDIFASLPRGVVGKRVVSKLFTAVASSNANAAESIWKKQEH
jgi:hypothetical protein